MIRLIEKLLREVPLSVFPGRSGPYAFIVRDGGTGPADTRQAFVFTASSREPALVVKVARERFATELLRREHANLTWLQGAPDEAFRTSVPKPVFLKERRGYAFLAETVVPGRRIKELEPHAFLESRRLSVLVDWLAAFARYGGRRREADDGLINRRIVGVASRYLESFEVSSVEWDLLQGLGRQAEQQAAKGDVVLLTPCHGDFCDANLMWDGRRLGVVDWEGEREEEFPFFDLFYALLSLVVTPVGLGSAEGMQRAFRDAFLEPTAAAQRVGEAVADYAKAIGVQPGWARVAFPLAWCRFALAKQAYLEATFGRGQVPADRRGWLAGLAEANEHLPLVRLEGASCLNVRLACEGMDRLAFMESVGG